MHTPDLDRPRHKPAPYGRGACLSNDRARTALSYMKSASVTIRLDAKLERELNQLSRQLGRSRSDLVRDALRRQFALARFEQARRAMLPLAEAQGFLTDEDVFADVSWRSSSIRTCSSARSRPAGSAPT